MSVGGNRQGPLPDAGLFSSLPMHLVAVFKSCNAVSGDLRYPGSLGADAASYNGLEEGCPRSPKRNGLCHEQTEDTLPASPALTWGARQTRDWGCEVLSFPSLG